MRPFEIQTPALRSVVESANAVRSGLSSGTMEKDVASGINKADANTVRAVGEELKVRLAMPKLAAMEAKMIEASAQQQIGQQAA
jgi:hypothetical protein